LLFTTIIVLHSGPRLVFAFDEGINRTNVQQTSLGLNYKNLLKVDAACALVLGVGYAVSSNFALRS